MQIWHDILGHFQVVTTVNQARTRVKMLWTVEQLEEDITIILSYYV
jgi:hypothetical protein